MEIRFIPSRAQMSAIDETRLKSLVRGHFLKLVVQAGVVGVGNVPQTAGRNATDDFMEVLEFQFRGNWIKSAYILETQIEEGLWNDRVIEKALAWWKWQRQRYYCAN